LGSCIIPALGPYRHFGAAFDFGFNANLAEAAGRSGICGLIADGVLIADVVRHLAADFIDFIERLGEKCQAASPLRDNFQRLTGLPRVLFIA
jgi:hypothetical protein